MVVDLVWTEIVLTVDSCGRVQSVRVREGGSQYQSASIISIVKGTFY